MQSLEYHPRVNKDIASMRKDKRYCKRKRSTKNMASLFLVYRTWIYKYHIKVMNVNLAKWNRTKGKTNVSKVPLLLAFLFKEQGLKVTLKLVSTKH